MATLTSALTIPKIIKVSLNKQLLDRPDGFRKTHLKEVPALGGIAIFLATIFSYSTMVDYTESSPVYFFIPSIVILFFAGVKDDLDNLPAFKKLLIQLICSGIIVVFGKLQLTNLWGMFYLTDIPYWIGVILSIAVMTTLINAVNLIDGINGLAGTLGLLACLFFGTWFYKTETMTYAILSFGLAGGILGFLFYNFYRAKIFMGDTGSMIIGFSLAILLIKFVELNRTQEIVSSPYYVKLAPAVGLSVLLIPTIDLFRVFIVRAINGKGPFTADRSHIHHILADAGLSHCKTTFVLVLTSLLSTIITLIPSQLRSLETITLATIPYFILFLYFKLLAFKLRRR